MLHSYKKFENSREKYSHSKLSWLIVVVASFSIWEDNSTILRFLDSEFVNGKVGSDTNVENYSSQCEYESVEGSKID